MINYNELRQLEPQKRKKLILESLAELTQNRDRLERQIRQLCKLWDETVGELDRQKAVKTVTLSDPSPEKTRAGQPGEFALSGPQRLD